MPPKRKAVDVLEDSPRKTRSGNSYPTPSPTKSVSPKKRTRRQPSLPSESDDEILLSPHKPTPKTPNKRAIPSNTPSAVISSRRAAQDPQSDASPTRRVSARLSRKSGDFSQPPTSPQKPRAALRTRGLFAPHPSALLSPSPRVKSPDLVEVSPSKPVRTPRRTRGRARGRDPSISPPSPSRSPSSNRGSISRSGSRHQTTGSNRQPSSSPDELENISPATLSIAEPETLDPMLTCSPRKKLKTSAQHLDLHGCSSLPNHLHNHLAAQKRVVLRALRHPPTLHNTDDDDDEQNTNEIAKQQLSDLLSGSGTRGEGNSCFILGPRGSGKTRIVEECVSEMSSNPVVVRLSGWVQLSDRQALREMTIQLARQLGKEFFMEDSAQLDDDDDAFDGEGISLPPSSQLPDAIARLPTFSRPTVVILDAIDLFALHPRQTLLYCLLDTAQNCRGGAEHRGLSIIGVTSRVDTINLLEKRVKSRFSGRMFRTAGPSSSKLSVSLLKDVLVTEVGDNDDNDVQQWRTTWKAGVEHFFDDYNVLSAFSDTFCLSRDLTVLLRLITSVMIQLSPTRPVPTSELLNIAITQQRARPSFSFLRDLPYAFLCLLVASAHRETQGHCVFNFEMLYESYGDQSKASTSAPIQVNGASIGMKRCSRSVLIGAFESLIALKVFTSAGNFSTGTAKEFHKYRCVVERSALKDAVNRSMQTDLKRWLHKAQDSR